jgi:hypothetical protein
MKSLFSSEYENYGDVFFPAEYMEIAENPQIAYAIDLEEGVTAFYGSIYYLSEKELRVLREYLEES